MGPVRSPTSRKRARRRCSSSSASQVSRAGGRVSTAAIVVIGNEVLSAKVSDENGPFLARELRALGVELRRIETVPDEVPLIVDGLARCRSHARWVFTSGGIGPTHDDVTIAAVAQAFGRGVVHDERTLELLRSRFGEPLKPALRRSGPRAPGWSSTRATSSR